MPRKPRRRRCIECDSLYSRLGGVLRCPECQLIAKGNPEALRDWWTDRFELGELQEFARALWPDLSSELPWLALAG